MSLNFNNSEHKFYLTKYVYLYFVIFFIVFNGFIFTYYGNLFEKGEPWVSIIAGSIVIPLVTAIFLECTIVILRAVFKRQLPGYVYASLGVSAAIIVPFVYLIGLENCNKYALFFFLTYPLSRTLVDIVRFLRRGRIEQQRRSGECHD